MAEKTKRVIALVHGIHNSHKDSKLWMSTMGKYLVENHNNSEEELVVKQFRYGWVSGFSIRFPGIGLWTRSHYVRKFMKWVKRICQEEGVDRLDGIFHSFGTHIGHKSMTNDSRFPKTFFRRIVYMGGMVSARENFDNEEGHFEKVLCMFSREDEVIRFAPFGHCGYRGFNHADGLIVVNKDMTPYEHGYYTRYGDAWPLINDFLNSPK